MNEVSIIINGVRYDAVGRDNPRFIGCEDCELKGFCESPRGHDFIRLCSYVNGHQVRFKKSDKKFEK